MLMSFISVKFLLFLLTGVLIYYALPVRYRGFLILPMNLLFYVFSGWKGLIWITLTAFISWTGAGLMQKQQDHCRQERKRLKEAGYKGMEFREKEKPAKARMTRHNRVFLTAGILAAVGIWAFFKNARGSIAVPLAISYYTFMAVSYMADVYNRKYSAEKNFLRYYTWLTFFPQMVEGPFSRYDKQAAQITAEHRFDSEAFSRGCLRILWGYCKKLVLADYLWLIISFYLENEKGPVYQTLLLVVLLPLQQYADFSGCMDIAIGTAGLFGIRLPENFRSPVFSQSIDEVWRRWHITLGAFCKDYIFYPVALLKNLNHATAKIFRRKPAAGQKIPVLTALFCVWTFIGLWHGFAWKYLIWGWMNLFFISSGILLSPIYASWKKRLHVQADGRAWKLFCIVRTYLIFGIMELVSDGSSASAAFRRFISFFQRSGWRLQNNGYAISLLPGTTVRGTAAAAVVAAAVLAIDILKEKNVDVYDSLRHVPLLPRYLLYIAALFMIVLFCPSGENINAGFAYANF